MLFQNFQAPSQPPLSRVKQTALALCAAGAMFAALGIVFLIGMLSEEPQVPISVSDVSAAELQAGAVYRIDELYVADVYAEYTETERITGKTLRVNEEYYVVLLPNTDGKLIALSLAVKKGDGIKSAVDAYMADPELGLGDLFLSGYFEAKALDAELLGFYQEALDFYTENELELDAVMLDLQYACSLDTDYAKFAKQQQLLSLIAPLLFLLLGAFFIVWGSVGYRQLKKQAQAAPKYSLHQEEDTTEDENDV